MKPVLSVMAKYSSLNNAGDTAFADPPDPVVFVRKSCSFIAPVSASRENADTHLSGGTHATCSCIKILGRVATAVGECDFVGPVG